MTLPKSGIEIARFRLPPPQFGANIGIGMVHNSNSAVLTGYLDEVTNHDEVLPRAQEVAFSFASSIEPNAFAANKMLTRRPTIEFFKSKQCKDEREYLLSLNKGLLSKL